jgi:hypothetical protein
LTSLGEIIEALLNETRAILKEYVHETEAAFKKPQKASNYKHNYQHHGIFGDFIHRICFPFYPHRVAEVSHDFHAHLEGWVHHRNHLNRYWSAAPFGALHHHKKTIEISIAITKELGL